MQIFIGEEKVLELSETQKSVIKYDINEDLFEDDMKRRVAWVLTHKYDQCFERLKKDWDPILASNGVTMIPTDKDEYAQLVFSQSNYKSKKTRDEEAQAQNT